MNVTKATYSVVYAGKDITTDISPYLLSLTYTDKTQGAADEIEIVVEDTDGHWRNDWYPTKGDTLKVSIGIDGVTVPCGTFEIDETEISGLPHQISIRGLAAGVVSPLRTKTSHAYEDQSLAQIADTVAARHGLAVVGQIDDLQLRRVTQRRETDLGFLARIAKEFGYIFSVRGTDLVFTSVFDLEAADAVVQVDLTDLMSYSIQDKTVGVFKSATTNYQDPQTGDLQTGDAPAASDADIANGDVLEVRTRSENAGQAKLRAKAALHDHNSRQQSGTLSLPGSPLMLAGNNFDLTGLGVLSGLYHILTSTHRIDANGGYTTSVEIKRVGFINKTRYAPKKKRATKYKYTTVQ